MLWTYFTGIALVAAGVSIATFGIPLVIFGIQHLMYGRFVATLVPSWIPGRLCWAYFVGVAFVAAAIGIATKKKGTFGRDFVGNHVFPLGITSSLPQSSCRSAPHNLRSYNMLHRIARQAGTKLCSSQKRVASCTLLL